MPNCPIRPGFVSSFLSRSAMTEDLISSIATKLKDLEPDFDRLNVRLEREISRRQVRNAELGNPELEEPLMPEFRTDNGPGAAEEVPASPLDQLLASRDSAITGAISKSHQSSRTAGEVETRLDSLHQILGLSEFDRMVIVLCLAQELDSNYELIFAHLLEDVTSRQPTVGLALTLLAGSPEERIALRRAFGNSSSLIKYGAVQLADDPYSSQESLLDKRLSLDPRLVDYLLGIPVVDQRLLPFVELWDQEKSCADTVALPGHKGWLPELTERIEGILSSGGSVHLKICGPEGSGKRSVAKAICTALGRKLLAVDCALLLAGGQDPQALLRLVHREALLQNAVLYLRGICLSDNPGSQERALANSLETLLSERRDLTIAAGEDPQLPTRLPNHAAALTMEIPVSGLQSRKLLWQQHLSGHETQLFDGEIELLAGRYEYNASQIRDAVSLAQARAKWRSPENPSIALEDFMEGRYYPLPTGDEPCHPGQQSGYSWDDLVLPEDRKRQLLEICSCYQRMPLVYRDWGFDDGSALGKGLKALFVGSSGTGKTMAAEIIARALGMKLQRVDISAVVSKYVGDTEKHLDRVFQEAGDRRHVLLFDEADALFGKRGEIRYSSDRYSNIEVSYLLQRMDEYQGIAILTTNLRSNMDEAFLRRLHYSVDFPLPDERLRLEMWRRVFPSQAPVHPNVDLEFMAGQFQLTGGNIRNIALASAFLAAHENSDIEMKHLVLATRREFQKMGKLLTEQDFGPYLEPAVV